MMYSALCILLTISLVNGLPDSYLDNFSGWLTASSENPSENKTENAKNQEIINDGVRRVVDDSDKDIQVVNPDKPIKIDDFLEEFKKDAPTIKQEERNDVVGTLQQLRKAVYDDSMRKVKVLYRGFWHAVDLGIAGTSQRQRSAEKTDGVIDSIANLFRAFNKWFWSWFYTEEDENDKDDKNDSEKDKEKDKKEDDKDKVKDKDKDGKDKEGKEKAKKAGTGGEKEHETLKDDDSDDDHDDSPEKRKAKDIILKPSDPKTHTSANGKVTFDTKWKEGVGGQSVQEAMKTLSELTSLLGDKLMTREEVDKELKEAQDKKDDTNRFLNQVKKAKQIMVNEKDEREWTEAAAKDKLDEMNKDFDKTTDKAAMVKDIKSLSMQPLYYIETYDRIMDMVDRLKDSGVPEKDLLFARDSLFNQKLFSLEHSIQQTPRKQYQAERYEHHLKTAKKEREHNKDIREWAEEDALKRIDEIDKNFGTTTDKAVKEAMLKDITSICMQPSYNIKTYDKLYLLMEKLSKNGQATDAELETAQNALTRKSRYTYMNGILHKAEMQEHERFKLQKDEAKEKREKQKDTREFTEEDALKHIKEMNDNFDSKNATEMTKDVTNLCMQPLYQVETYDKLADLIGKLKKKGVANDALKPAEESLEEEKEFSIKHDLRQKPEGSLEDKLQKLRIRFMKGKPLEPADKQELYKELEVLRKQENFTPKESVAAFKLINALMGNDNAIQPEKITELLQFVNTHRKDSASPIKMDSANSSETTIRKDSANSPETKIQKDTASTVLKTSTEYRAMEAKGIKPEEFVIGKVNAKGEASPA